MSILFSSIAWKYPQAYEAAVTLRELGVQGIEASPGIFTKPFTALDSKDIAAVRRFWEDQKLPVAAMQALLFGQPNLKLFGTPQDQQELADYLCLVFRVAGQLGGGPLIFGSPKNRLRGTLTPQQAFDSAAEFFRNIAPKAAAEGCTLCIEANAPGYGCDFITTHQEAVRLVAAVNCQGFGLQIDTGVMAMNNENADDILGTLQQASVMPAHMHLSMPYLEPVTTAFAQQCTLYQGLKNIGYTGHLSVEMKAPDTFSVAARHAVAAAQRVAGVGA